ncbi:hypothetical protein Gotri_019033 [Gossypium trilobum]|uniref:Uncharacterized protein n=1 Tax=Gossypium trilobum TaxID=34281 RepID=A0A7J9EBH6_9ROSI|nr:hypothetical protein [Gossypium trilobum]
MVVAEDAAWNSYISSHKAFGQFRHRSFPYYDQLTSIYAKERATGKDAQTVANIVEEIDAEDEHCLRENDSRKCSKIIFGLMRSRRIN